MIFLIGSQKSGTTWLRDCFAHVCPVPKREWYFPEFYENISKHIDTFSHLPEPEKKTAVRDVVAVAWKELLEATAPNATFDKSAYPCTSTAMPVRHELYPFAVRLAREVFPKASTVVLVRDPRGVLNSTVHYLNHFRAGWGDEIDPAELGANWQTQNSQWLDDEPSVVVRYEDLKSNFIGTMSRILFACGIPHDLQLIERIRANEFNIDNVRHRQPEIYRVGDADSYKRELDPSKIQRVAEAAKGLMTRLGYQRA